MLPFSTLAAWTIYKINKPLHIRKLKNKEFTGEESIAINSYYFYITLTIYEC